MCSDGRVTHPALQPAQCLATLDVLVIAGGLGTRIQSALGDTPKLLAPIGGYVQGTSTMFGTGFGPGPGANMRELWHNDPERVFDLKRELRLRGVFTKPTPRDIWYVSSAHTPADIDETLVRAQRAVAALT